MRLAIVGNFTPQIDFSSQIDACDLIIRFNLTRNFNSKMCGSRTDILCLQRLDKNTERRFLQSRLNPDVLSSAKEIWWLNTLPDIMIDLIKEYGVKNKLIKIIDDGFREIRDVEFYWVKKRRNFSPSSGFALIHHLLNNKDYDGFTKELYAFSFDGSNGHDWDLEKNICEYYQSCGLLKIIS